MRRTIRTIRRLSAHGLRVVGADLVLDDVVVEAGLAKDGTGGMKGTKGDHGLALAPLPHIGIKEAQHLPTPLTGSSRQPRRRICRVAPVAAIWE